MRFFPVRPGLAQLPRIAQDASGVQTLHSAAAFRQFLLEKIATARQRIYLCSLYLQHDEAGAEVLAALYAAKAAHPQLDVAVLVDWHRAQRGLIGAPKGPMAGNAVWYQEQARQHAASVPIYGVPVQSRELFGVLHLKGFVLDDTVIYSGASLNNVYLHKLDKYRHDRYLIIENKVLADSLVQFMRHHVLAASSAVHRLDLPEIPPTRQIRPSITQFRDQLKKANYHVADVLKANDDDLTVTPLVGVGKNNRLNKVICQLLASCQQQLTICTPYFNFPLAIRREISKALKRGVKIDIIVGDKTANDFYIPPSEPFKFIGALPYLYETNVRRFVKKYQKQVASGQLNLHLWKHGENSYHLKGIWIDRHYSLMTGNNLNPRAFRLDLENALLIHDPRQELAAQQQAELQSILHHTTRIGHYSSLQDVPDYPHEVRKLLTRLSRTRLDRLFYRVL